MFYKIARAIVRPIIYLLFRPRIEGFDNFPAEGATIVYSNHSSNLDPVILGVMLPRRIFFMAKIELFKNPLFSCILRNLGAFPVKRGKADISSIKKSLQILKQDKVLGIFPEGTRNRSGEIKDFSHGLASIAHKSKASVVPIAIVNGYHIFRPTTIKIGNALKYEKYYNERSNNQMLDKMSEDMKIALKLLL